MRNEYTVRREIKNQYRTLIDIALIAGANLINILVGFSLYSRLFLNFRDEKKYDFIERQSVPKLVCI